MKNLKARTIWITIGIILLITIGLIFWCPNTSGFLNKVIVVAIAIGFIFLTILVQLAAYKSFKVKPKNISYKRVEYKSEVDLERILISNGFKLRERSFGKSYLKIDGAYAYKVVLVGDIAAYFNFGDDVGEPNAELDKCKKLIGVEIFLVVDKDTLNKIPDFTFQGPNVYYTAYIKQDDRLICLNYEDPNEDNKEIYDNLAFMLKLENIENE